MTYDFKGTKYILQAKHVLEISQTLLRKYKLLADKPKLEGKKIIFFFSVNSVGECALLENSESAS